MINWYSDSNEVIAACERLRNMAQKVEPYLTSKRSFAGYCVCCNKVVDLKVASREDGGWSDLRECILCECGLNGRMRMIWAALEESPPRGRFLMMERVTPLYKRVSERYPFVEGCEYFGNSTPPGSLHSVGAMQVRHESMLDFSYESDSFDFLFHGDVLEHVPDHVAALQECFRILKKDGILLFSTPFFGGETNNIRCRSVDGELFHYSPPAFHGNPVDSTGSLVFTDFGWQLLDDVRNAGFSMVEVGLLYDPFQGIVSNNNPYREGHMWPLIFRAKK